MIKVGQRVALCVIGDGHTAVRRQKILPRAIITIGNTVLGQDVAVVIIGHGIDHRAADRFGKKLTESIVGVLGNIGDRLVISSLIRLGYGGDSFLGIILIRNSSVIKDIISFSSKHVNKNFAPQMKLNISTFNAKGKLATEVASKTHMF